MQKFENSYPGVRIFCIKRKFDTAYDRSISFLLYFLRKGVKLHFYSLGTIFEENMRVSRGMQSLGSGFPIGARSIPVGTRFCLQSLVCYTFCDRRISQKCTGKGLFHARQSISSGSRTGGLCGLKGTQNEGFGMSKIRLFGCSWHRKS